MKLISIALIIPSILLPINSFASMNKAMPTREFTEKQSIFDRNPHINILDALGDTRRKSDEVLSSIRFLSLAIQAWNPSLNPNDVERIITEKFERQNITKALIEPALALIDISYAAGRPEFGNMMNPMLRQIAPDIANGLHRQYGLPMDFNGASFASVNSLNDRQILTTMRQVLGDEFSKATRQSISIDDSKDFMSEAILGKSSFLGFTARNLNPNQVHNEDPAEPRGYQPKKDYSGTPMQTHGDEDSPKSSVKKADWVSTPRSANSYNEERPRGLFSKLDIYSMTGECVARCTSDIIDKAGSGANWGSLKGRWGFLGGAIAGAITGAIICANSSECTKPEPKKSEPPVKPEPKTDPNPKPESTPEPKPKDPSEPTPSTGSSDPKPADSNPPGDSGTPSTPKEPDTDNGDDTPDDDDADDSVYVRFLENKKLPGIDFEKRQKDFKQISTPMRGN